MPGTVLSNAYKTVQRNSLSSGAHAPVECGCHGVVMLPQWFAAIAGPFVFQVFHMPSDE